MRHVVLARARAVPVQALRMALSLHVMSLPVVTAEVACKDGSLAPWVGERARVSAATATTLRVGVAVTAEATLRASWAERIV